MESKKEPRSSVKRYAEYTNHDLPPSKKSSDGVTCALVGQTKTGEYPDSFFLFEERYDPQQHKLLAMTVYI